MTGKRRADARHAARPWHERTPLVIGASVAALAVIALLYFTVTWVMRNSNQPPAPPTQYLEPTDTVTRIGTTTATTTPTITSTVPPQTTEIANPTPEPSTSGTSGSSDTSATDTSPTTTTPTTTTSVSITQSRHSHYGPDPDWNPQRPRTRVVSPSR